MPTSRRSSTPATTSAPTERALLAALADAPFWSDEPLATVMAERLGWSPRATRDLLAQLDVTLEVPGALFGRLDETWLLRGRAPAAPIEGVVQWEELGERYLLVRTLARDAVEREKRLRALYAALHERPLAQLERPAPPPPPAGQPRRKLAREDLALLAAARATPFAPLDALADAADVGLRVAKEKLPRLVAERALVLDARPKARALQAIVVRASPSSTAAARDAFACFGSLVHAWLPASAEASLADGVALEATAAEVERALDVPGIASVEALPIARAWRDEAALAALLTPSGA